MQQQKIYDIINRDNHGMLASRLYDWYMLVMIIGSVVPLMFIDDYPVFKVIELVTVVVFIIDYLLRWMTSDIRLKKRMGFIYHLPVYPDGDC